METTPIKLAAANVNEATPNANQSSNRSSAAKFMSSSLREKLKRSRQSFRSPLGVVKRLKIEDETEPQPREEKQDEKDDRDTDTDVNRNDTKQLRDRSNHTAKLAQKHSNPQCESLRKAVKDKSEVLRRLKMVKMYRKKNDLNELQRLTDKWRSCAQSVLFELQRELATGGKPASLSELIDSFGIDDKLLHFDRTEEDFTDT